MNRRLNEWVSRQNIKQFEAAMKRATDDGQREVLKGMIEREEARLQRLMDSLPDSRPNGHADQ